MSSPIIAKQAQLESGYLELAIFQEIKIKLVNSHKRNNLHATQLKERVYVST